MRVAGKNKSYHLACARRSLPIGSARLMHTLGPSFTRREEAENNRQLQEHFIDVTCHELRNPLNAISNSAELLGESLRRMQEREREWAKIPVLQALLEPMKADLQEDMEAVETILLSSRHQKRIADDVLHVSKISACSVLQPNVHTRREADACFVRS